MATISQNASIVELLRDTVTGSMYSKAWHDDNGINSRGDDKVGDWYTIRAFSAVYHRNVTDPDLRSQIREYLGVQYNALLDFARVPGSDIYGDSWTVAPGPGFVVDSSKQTAALPVLISAISLRNETNTTDNDLPTSTSTTSTTTTPSIKSSSTSGKSHLTTGAIAGTVVGGTTFLIGAGIGIWILLRRRRHLKKHLHSVTPYPIGTRDNKNPESRMRKISRPDLAKRQMITQHQSSQPSNQARTERTELSTEQLLRLLSSRLEAGRSEVGEMPPEYTSESSEWAR
ncbi:hypothetical protein E1B28_010574 [Marasmius oreades]|uniref:Uncharacterized protein n=1 Tax=Marasmius oreades TaxID=181124 RepID=A0A9P7RXJ3_9AGAR|nr:uncharacterized protein E1B28_010574 [Marasmius oreades]KAG7091545.1 hypothetical protein E1B28_010574 [Marasmius oreades]